MRASIILTCAAILSIANPASAQARPMSTDLIGARVRITLAAIDSATPGRVVIGDLIGASDSILLIRGRKAALDERIAISRIQGFEVRTGKNRTAGAGFGAITGLVFGFTLGLILGDDCSYTDFICFDRTETSAGGAFLGAALGMSIGALVGRGDRWRAAEVPATVGVLRRVDGLALAATMRF